MIPQSRINKKRLLEAFPMLSEAQAKDLNQWIHRPVSIMDDEFRDEFDRYPDYPIWSKDWCVGKIMEKFDKWVDNHGVETIRYDKYDNYFGDARADYSNTGDSYSITLLYDLKFQRFYITSWSDFVEKIMI